METTQKKKLTILSILGLSSLSLIVSAALMGKAGIIKPMNAMDCTHETVEHYHGKNALDGEIEHWACCACHTAWADEGRTIKIGNTVDDRSKISFETLCRYQVQWDANLSEPVYDAENGFVYRNYLSNLGAGESNAFETTSSGFTLEEKGYSYYGGVFTNKTNSKLTGTLYDRAWNKVLKNVEINAGESYSFVISAEDWKNSQSGGNYGFAFLLANESEVSEGSYVEISKPKFLNDPFSRIETSGEHWKDFVVNYDVQRGFVYEQTVESNVNFYIRERQLLDSTKYLGVKFSMFNGTSQDATQGNIWNEDWVNSCVRPVLKANSWTEVTIPLSVWNGGNSGIGFYDLHNAAGLYKFGNFELIEKGAPYVCFGKDSNEKLTMESTDKKWSEAEKTTDVEKGKIFRIPYTNQTCFVTNSAKPVDASVYTTIEFDVYNGCDRDFTMNSTVDWASYTNYGTLAKGEWTHCSMPVDEFNNSGNKYFYPQGSLTGEILVTYFVAVAK